MKCFLTLMAVFLIYNCFGQCEYSKDEIDKFTGRHYVETTGHKLFGNSSQYMVVSFAKIDSIGYINLSLGHFNCFYIPSGAELTFNYSGGSQMKLKRYSSSSDVAKSIAGSYTWTMTTGFVLNESELFQLQNKIITGVRLDIDKGYIESTEIKSKFAIKIKEIANCVSISPGL